MRSLFTSPGFGGARLAEEGEKCRAMAAPIARMTRVRPRIRRACMTHLSRRSCCPPRAGVKECPLVAIGAKFPAVMLGARQRESQRGAVQWSNSRLARAGNSRAYERGEMKPR